MSALGAAALAAALLTSIYTVVSALIGARTGDRRWVDSSRRAYYAVFGLLLVAVVALESAFLRSDFSLELVAGNSSTTTPTLYKATAMWGSQAGSLLLWAFVLSIAGSAVLYATRNRLRELAPWATAVMAGVATFFIGLMMAGTIFPSAETYPFAALAAAQVVVEEQPEPHHPGRTQARAMGQHEPQRPDYVRRRAQQHLAFNQGLADQAEFVVLEVAQAAMDQLRGGRRGGVTEVGGFAEQHAETPPGGIARDSRAIDAATDDQKINDLGITLLSSLDHPPLPVSVRQLRPRYRRACRQNHSAFRRCSLITIIENLECESEN